MITMVLPNIHAWTVNNKEVEKEVYPVIYTSFIGVYKCKIKH